MSFKVLDAEEVLATSDRDTEITYARLGMIAGAVQESLLRLGPRPVLIAKERRLQGADAIAATLDALYERPLK